MKSEEEVRWSEIFSSAYITKSLLEWGRKAEQPCSVQLKVLQKAFLGSLRLDIPLPPCPPLVRSGTAWSSSRSGGYHWSQVAAWGAAGRPAVLAPPPPSPTAPEQQLLLCLFFCGKVVVTLTRPEGSWRGHQQGRVPSWKCACCPPQHWQGLQLHTANLWNFSGSSLKVHFGFMS